MINTLELLNEVVRHYQNGNLKESEIICRQVLNHEPENPDALHFLGIIAWAVGELEVAKQYIEKSISIYPQNPSCYLNMGNVFQKEKKYEASLEWYKKALNFDYAEKAKVHNSIGVAMTKLNRFQEAIEHLQKAVDLEPGYSEAYNNLSVACKGCGMMDLAIETCEKAVQLVPEFAAARWNRSILWFLTGDFEKAWPESEWRWQRPETPKRLFDTGEPWNGQPLEGKTLFVYEEQGMGDTIQFVRYLPHLKPLGGRIILEVIPPLVRLMERFDGFDRLWVGQKNVDTRPVDRFDYHIPMLSLPRLFNTSLDTIPANCPYINADATLSKIWQRRISPGQGINVGVVWAGHPDHENDQNRSIPLTLFSELNQVKGVRLFSLQKEKHDMWTDMDVEDVFEMDLGEEISDFADTAAIIDNLDLVISVDTAVVHLAGAMGKDVWTLLPFSPDWRWMLDRNDSPWYPSMQLFRQSEPGDWNRVISKIKQSLTLMLHQMAGGND